MTSSNFCSVSNFGECRNKYCVGMSYGIENAQSTIIRPNLSFNFHSSKLHSLKIVVYILFAVQKSVVFSQKNSDHMLYQTLLCDQLVQTGSQEI